MDIGEQFTMLELHIFNFAEKQFEANGIPPSFRRLIMEGVYSKFQTEALNQALLSQVDYSKDADNAGSDKKEGEEGDG